jgi:hypothetical protein
VSIFCVWAVFCSVTLPPVTPALPPLPDPILLPHKRQQASLLKSGERSSEGDLYHAGEPSDFDSAGDGGVIHLFGGSLYAILGHDNVPIPCDIETWNEWLPLKTLKRHEKFECSPEIEATVFFSGRCTPELCMDGRPKFWAANFFDRKTERTLRLSPSVFETLDRGESIRR